ncbi:MAG: translation initiation factor IF-2, partial [Erysipelotrichaceae bacterium]|nr:translation initiation factor IF-2 [Erysipelotrichaceae bacterium]
EGVIKRDQKVNVIRDGVVIQKNKRIASLKHLTEDIKEARVNFDFGFTLVDFADIKELDRIEAFDEVEENEN